MQAHFRNPLTAPPVFDNERAARSLHDERAGGVVPAPRPLDVDRQAVEADVQHYVPLLRDRRILALHGLVSIADLPYAPLVDRMAAWIKAHP